jgi:hypothetical protein
MATYFNDCSSLEGWSEIGWWGGSDYKIVDEVIRGNGNGTVESLKLNNVSSDLNNDNIEILVKWKNTSMSVATYRVAAVRASGTTFTNRNCWSVQVRPNALRTYYCVAGTETQLATTTIPILSADRWYWIRFRVTGSSPTDVKARIWAEGDQEPVIWQCNNTTNEGPVGTGSVGLYGTDITSFYGGAGFGTSGNSAPFPAPIEVKCSSALHVSQRMLREPRLLMPGMQPVGNVKIDKSNSLYQKYFSTNAQCWVLNQPGWKWKNLTRAGSKYDLIATNETDSDPQVPRLLAGKRGYGIGYYNAVSVFNGGGYNSVTAWPSQVIYTKTWHWYGNTTLTRGNPDLIRESQYSRIRYTPGTSLVINIANKNLISSITTLPSETFISVVAYDVSTTQYARVFLNGVFIEELSATKDIQPDNYPVYLGHAEWYLDDFSNSFSNNFFYGPIYFAYSGRNERWSNTDVIALHRDPYQFLIPA